MHTFTCSYIHIYLSFVYRYSFLYFVIFYLSLSFLAFMHFYHVFLTCFIYSIRYVYLIFISYSCFMNTSIHISFSIFSLFHAYYMWHFIYLHNMIPMYSHIIHVFLSRYKSTLLRNWNHSNWIIQTKVMAFSCRTSQFTDITLGTVCNTHFPVS